MKKVIVLSSSPRKGGNSDILADGAVHGAEAKGYQVLKFSVGQMNIKPCLACEYCHTKGNGVCVQKDDMQAVLKELSDCYALILATPIYFDEMSAQLKTALDRTYCMFMGLRIKKAGFIATAANDDERTVHAAFEGYRAYIGCLQGTEDAGIVFATGASDKGDVSGTAAMEKAYNLGFSL